MIHRILCSDPSLRTDVEETLQKVQAIDIEHLVVHFLAALNRVVVITTGRIVQVMVMMERSADIVPTISTFIVEEEILGSKLISEGLLELFGVKASEAFYIVVQL